MVIIDDLVEGRIRLFCSRIRLQRGDAQPFSVAGPGSMEINDSGHFEYSVHISADIHHKGFVGQFSRMRPAGTVLRKEDSFSLRGTSYDGQISSIGGRKRRNSAVRSKDIGCGGRSLGHALRKSFRLRNDAKICVPWCALSRR